MNASITQKELVALVKNKEPMIANYLSQAVIQSDGSVKFSMSTKYGKVSLEAALSSSKGNIRVNVLNATLDGFSWFGLVKTEAQKEVNTLLEKYVLPISITGISLNEDGKISILAGVR